MAGERNRKLSREDRVLWSTVARTVNPLPGRKMPELPHTDPLPEVPRDDARPHHPEPQIKGMPKPPSPGGLDRPTRKKLAKGRLQLEAKLDLHGMTQAEAHSVLLGFLHRAYHDGRRHVLVVTGKGSSLGSEGVLRRAVPAWLATPAFRGLVSGHEDAARHHGGGGAMYIRLRKREGQQ